MTIYGVRTPDGAANTKILYKGFEISIAMDDSCGTYGDYWRSSIRLFKDNKDVTYLLAEGDDSLIGEGHALRYVFAWIDLRHDN